MTIEHNGKKLSAVKKEVKPMPKRVNPLLLEEIESAVTKQKDYKLYDGLGLYLLVTREGSKLWRLDYRFSDKPSDVECIKMHKPRVVRGHKTRMHKPYTRNDVSRLLSELRRGCRDKFPLKEYNSN